MSDQVLELQMEVTATSKEAIIKLVEQVAFRISKGFESAIFENEHGRVNFAIVKEDTGK
jgi:hypothetical protein